MIEHVSGLSDPTGRAFEALHVRGGQVRNGALEPLSIKRLQRERMNNRGLFVVLQGNALKDAGRVDEAITCYQTSLALQPNHPQALTNLGNIYMEW
jgi:Flp pilus assembly protein TadD